MNERSGWSVIRSAAPWKVFGSGNCLEDLLLGNCLFFSAETFRSYFAGTFWSLETFRSFVSQLYQNSP